MSKSNSKAALSIILFVFLGACTLIIFQNCGPQNFETLGNGDPYEGMDTTDGIIPTTPGGNGPIVPGDTSGGANDSVGEGTTPGSPTGSPGGNTGGGSPNGGGLPMSDVAPPATIPVESIFPKNFISYVFCPGNRHIDFIAYGENKKGKFKLLLRAKGGKLKSFPWNPNRNKTKIVKNLSKKVFAQNAWLNKKNRFKIFYFVKGSSKRKKHTAQCFITKF